MMPAEELAALQDVFTSACDQTVKVERNTSLGVPNPDGSVPQTLSTIYASLPALVDEPKGSYAQQLASALVDQAVWVMNVPATYNGAAVVIQRGDLVTFNGLAYTVQHLMGSESYQVNVNFMASRPR